jgi:hypothetical protein
MMRDRRILEEFMEKYLEEFMEKYLKASAYTRSEVLSILTKFIGVIKEVIKVKP